MAVLSSTIEFWVEAYIFPISKCNTILISIGILLILIGQVIMSELIID